MRQMDLLLTVPKMRFTRNWFRARNLPVFREHVYSKWSGRDIVYLEIGVFEGMSMAWMLQHVLFSEGSRAVGVDPWLMTTSLSEAAMTQVMIRAHENLRSWRETGAVGSDRKRCTLIRGNSSEVLRKMLEEGFAGISAETVDVLMVDGNHHALTVLDDLRLSFRLLRPGGWLLVDDVKNDIEKEEHVKEGLNMFLWEREEDLNLVAEGDYVEIYERVK